jgi:hypothetical protein
MVGSAAAVPGCAGVVEPTITHTGVMPRRLAGHSRRLPA